MFLKKIERYRSDLRNYLDSFILKPKTCDEINAASYVVLNERASLFRPLLTIAVSSDNGVADEKFIPVSSVLELVHVASLIEDDIADKSDKRRGKNSCHIEFGEDLAHMAKEYLVQRAYESIFDSQISVGLEDWQRVSIGGLASKTGLLMVRGQTKDIAQLGIETPQKIVDMYGEKSGALMGLALASGGIISSSGAKDIDYLNRIGKALGTSYQIFDDILDKFVDSKITGKPSRDSCKNTLLSVVGMEEAKIWKTKKDDEVDVLLDSLTIKSESLRDLINYVRIKQDKLLKL